MILFLIIVIYMLANIGFFYLNPQMEFPITEDESIRENVCPTLVNCFVAYFNIGMRFGGGIGEALKQLNYSDNTGKYFEQYFLEFFFFLFINLILLNMINGIIISPFTEWRQKDEEIYEDKKNI